MILFKGIISILRVKILSIKQHFFYSKYFQRFYFTKLSLDNIALAIFLGGMPLLFQHTLFSLMTYYIVIIIAIFLLFIPFSLIRFLALFLFFWVYSNLIAYALMARTVELVDNIVIFEANIVEYRQLSDGHLIIKIPIPKKTFFSSSIYASVYWRNPPKNIEIGQGWQFKVQFRAAHSYLNEADLIVKNMQFLRKKL